MDKQYDNEILSLVLYIRRKSGMTYFSLENIEFYNQYKTFADLYNKVRKISSREYLKSTLNMKVVNENLKNSQNIENAISYMKQLLSKNKSEQEIIELEAEYQRKLNDLIIIMKRSGVAPDDFQILDSFEEQYRIINTYHHKNEKPKLLKELIKKIDKFCQLYLDIIENILLKIENIANIVKQNRGVLELLPEAEPQYLKGKLFSLLKNNSKSNKYPIFKEFSKEIDEIYSRAHKLSKVHLYPQKDPYQYRSLNVIIRYNVYGIILVINKEKKECQISIDYDQLRNVLLNYKTEHFIRFLTKQLLSIPLDEMVKPTEVNELELKNYFKRTVFPVEKVLKYNIHDLLRQLGIYTEMNQDIPFKKLLIEFSKSEKSNTNHHLSIKLRDLLTLLEVLHEDGYSLKFNGKKIDNNKLIFEEILQTYKRISVHPTADKKIKEIISNILFYRSEEQDLIYSSLQVVYNSIDSNLINKMHQELNNQIPIDLADSLNKVIAIIRKFARNKDGKSYTIDEILTFIKSKNEIVNTKEPFEKATSYFIEEDLENTIATLSEYEDNINLSDVYEILYKITGKRR